jgi:hypothetical protein
LASILLHKEIENIHHHQMFLPLWCLPICSSIQGLGNLLQCLHNIPEKYIISDAAFTAIMSSYCSSKAQLQV